MPLDPRIEVVRKTYGLSENDFWQIPQNKQWVVKHAALEIVAAQAKIAFSAPNIIEADTTNGIAVMSVSGSMADRTEWATGEASPKNCKNSYPWAMAEKRAKDRVVLKLAGIHGLVYSEDEMPPGVLDEDRPLNLPKPKSSAELKRNGSWEEFRRELEECDTLVKLDKFRAAWREKAIAENWNATFKATARDEIEAQEERIKQADEFPGDRPNSYVNAMMAG